MTLENFLELDLAATIVGGATGIIFGFTKRVQDCMYPNKPRIYTNCIPFKENIITSASVSLSLDLYFCIDGQITPSGAITVYPYLLLSFVCGQRAGEGIVDIFRDSYNHFFHK